MLPQAMVRFRWWHAALAGLTLGSGLLWGFLRPPVFGDAAQLRAATLELDPIVPREAAEGDSRGKRVALQQAIRAWASAVQERELLDVAASADGFHKTPHTDFLESLLTRTLRSTDREKDVDTRLRQELQGIVGADLLSVKCVEAFCKVEFVVPSEETAIRGSVTALQAVSQVQFPLMLDFIPVNSQQLGIFYFPAPGENLPFPG